MGRCKDEPLKHGGRSGKHQAANVDGEALTLFGGIFEKELSDIGELLFPQCLPFAHEHVPEAEDRLHQHLWARRVFHNKVEGHDRFTCLAIFFHLFNCSAGAFLRGG